MKIFHHHTIHNCPACAQYTSHDANRSDAASFEHELPHARPSLVGALAGVVQLAATLYLLHVEHKRTAVRVDAEQATDARPPTQTATEAELPGSTPHDDVIAALFADATDAARGVTSNDNAISKDAQPPRRSSLAAAFLAAFRGQPTSA